MSGAHQHNNMENSESAAANPTSQWLAAPESDRAGAVKAKAKDARGKETLQQLSVTEQHSRAQRLACTKLATCELLTWL